MASEATSHAGAAAALQLEPYAAALEASMVAAGRPAPPSSARTVWPVDLAMLATVCEPGELLAQVRGRAILVIGCSFG
jgi:hypothetical protein